jgi:hypothetical protein
MRIRKNAVEFSPEEADWIDSIINGTHMRIALWRPFIQAVRNFTPVVLTYREFGELLWWVQHTHNECKFWRLQSLRRDVPSTEEGRCADLLEYWRRCLARIVRRLGPVKAEEQGIGAFASSTMDHLWYWKRYKQQPLSYWRVHVSAQLPLSYV